MTKARREMLEAAEMRWMSVEDAQITVSARELALLGRECTKLSNTLKRIQEWDCLNPPDPNLCADHPWLKRLVDEALDD